jgi:hypothetical protein
MVRGKDRKSPSAGASARDQHAAGLCNKGVTFADSNIAPLKFVDVIFLIGGKSGECQGGACSVGQFAGVAGDRFPTLRHGQFAKMRLQLLRLFKQLELRSEFQRVGAEQFDSVLEGVADGRQPLGYVLGSLGFRCRMRQSFVIMSPRDGSRNTKSLPNATEDTIALAHRRRDLQNSRNVCPAITGNSRERVQALAGSKRVPLTSG